MRRWLDVMYGLRNYARHHDNCAFAQALLTVPEPNAVCDCGFDEVEDAYDAATDSMLSLLQGGEGNG